MPNTEPLTVTEPARSLARQLRVKRSEMMSDELERVALRLYEARGFAEVTVEEIASEAGISVRTFYRYFAGKEDVFQRRIVRRSDSLRRSLSARPVDEPPLRSLRVALAEVQRAEDEDMTRSWIAVIVATPEVARGVLGGIQVHTQTVIRDFLGARLGVPGNSLAPTMLAAAVGGVIQAAHSRWFFHGGDLGETMASGLEVLERGIGSDAEAWADGIERGAGE